MVGTKLDHGFCTPRPVPFEQSCSGRFLAPFTPWFSAQRCWTRAFSSPRTRESWPTLNIISIPAYGATSCICQSARLFSGPIHSASRETKGEEIHILWRKVIERNRKLVSLYTGVSLLNITEVSQAILNRHSFVMTKPDKSTFQQNKTLALYRLLKAFVKFPHLAIEYLLCRADKEKFLHQKILQATRVLVQSNTASENSWHFDP